MAAHIRTIIAESTLQKRIAEMALEIDEYYLQQNWYQKTQEPVVVIGVLTGAVLFMADLVKKLSIRVELDFIRVSTYPGPTTIGKTPKIITPPTSKLYDSHVLLVDDILDSGKTLQIIQDSLVWPSPESMQTAVLLRKQGKAPSNVTADFVGFDIPDDFVVGYGLDYDGKYRTMPYVAVWSDDEFATSQSNFGWG